MSERTTKKNKDEAKYFGKGSTMKDPTDEFNGGAGGMNGDEILTEEKEV